MNQTTDSTTMTKLARAGYATRGIVYLLIGGLAAVSAIGASQVESEAAVDIIMEQPFGQVWIWLIVAGLAFFVLWRLAQGLFNADDRDNDLKGWAQRIGALASGGAYAALALYAGQQALQIAGSSGEGGNWTEWLMSQPFGRYLVAIGGLIFIGAGIAHIHYGVTRGFLKTLDSRVQDHAAIVAVSTYGLAARGVIFAVAGFLLVLAGWYANPEEGGGLSDAMTWLSGLPFGSIIYAATALGLFAYGAYGLVQARYRKIDGPALSEMSPHRVVDAMK